MNTGEAPSGLIPRPFPKRSRDGYESGGPEMVWSKNSLAAAATEWRNLPFRRRVIVRFNWNGDDRAGINAVLHEPDLKSN